MLKMARLKKTRHDDKYVSQNDHVSFIVDRKHSLFHWFSFSFSFVEKSSQIFYIFITHLSCMINLFLIVLFISSRRTWKIKRSNIHLNMSLSLSRARSPSIAVVVRRNNILSVRPYLVTLVTLRREKKGKGKLYSFFLFSFLVHHHIQSCCTDWIVNLTILAMP